MRLRPEYIFRDTVSCQMNHFVVCQVTMNEENDVGEVEWP